MTDQDTLLRQALLGDKDALGELLMSYRPLVCSVVNKFLNKRNLGHYADDVVQDVLLQAVAGFKNFDPTAGKGFKAWLGKIADNELLRFVDYLDRRTIRHEVPLEMMHVDEDGEELAGDRLDQLAFDNWAGESASVAPLPLQTNRSKPRRKLTGKKARKPKKVPPKGPGKGAHKKKTVEEMARINRNRMDYAEGIEP